MSQQQQVVSVRNGVLQFGGDAAFIGRESDFNQFIELSETTRLHRAAKAMHDFLTQMGSARTLASDLVRQRLVQIRQVLNPV